MDQQGGNKPGQEASRTRERWTRVLGAAVVLAPLAALYAPTFVDLGRVWRIDPNYSYGWLVVAASLFFAWQAWRHDKPCWQSQVGGGEIGLGWAALAIGLALHFVASFLGLLLLDVVGFVAVLRGVLLVLGGKNAVRAYGFACLFLIFMAPLPVAWYQPLANLMQHLAIVISVSTLGALGVPVFADGYVIRLPGHSLELVEACSGLRQLTAFLALAVAVGHLSGRAWWFKTVLAALSGVVALAANCLRVVLTVLVLLWLGPRWAEGTFHTIEGLVVVGLGLLMLIAAAWGLRCLEDRLCRVGLVAGPKSTECIGDAGKMPTLQADAGKMPTLQVGE